ncbi:MAG: CDP-alcohol phosphatidyltransferase family protein [Legionellaceae bacterium]|nr:CDP-alcohol phosphatidyltransferase family protein [Legionellaceae bacterium]
MLEESVRPSYQKLFVDPLIKLIANKVSPNTITLLSLLSGILFIPLMLTKHNYLAILFLLFSGYLDTVDGTLARHQNICSEIGAVIDIMADRIVEISVIFTFYLISPDKHGLATMLMLASCLLCITSFLVVGIFAENESNKSFNYSPGLIERPEAFGFFIAMIFLPMYFNSFAFLFSGLVLYTAIIRIYQFSKHVKIFNKNNLL